MKALFLRKLPAWIISVIICVLVASVISTQRVVNALNANGAGVGLSDRLSMTSYDAVHFGTLYGVFILIALLIAFLAAGLLTRAVPKKRMIVYIAAGTVAIWVMLFLMKQVFFGVPIVAGARDGLGLLLQGLAGGLAGYVFHRLTAPKSASKDA